MRKLILSVLIGTAACSGGADAPKRTDRTTAELDNEIAATIRLEDQTEIEMLKRRVVDLERAVGELKATPQTTEITLLKARLERLEVESLSPSPPVASPATKPKTESQ